MNKKRYTLDELLGNVELTPDASPAERKPSISALTLRSHHLFHRLMSERVIEDTLPLHVSDGESYHVISGGDVDSLSFLLWILRKQEIKHLVCSTWCIATTDIEELERQHRLGKIGKIDFYVGEILPGSYPNEYKKLEDLCRQTGGRIAVFRNHSKVMAGIGTEFSFAIESSANINTNPRTENTVITIGEDIAQFYIYFFDGIISFDKRWRK